MSLGDDLVSSFARRKGLGLRGLAVGMLGIIAACTPAQIALTTTAKNAGWILTRVVAGFPKLYDIGPLGIAFPDHGVLVTDFSGNVYYIPSDVDGSTLPSPLANNGAYNTNCLTRLGNQFFVGTNDGISLLNSNGTIGATIARLGSQVHPQDMCVNPQNRHLLVTCGGLTGIQDVDTIERSFSTYLTLPRGYVDPDGIATDGTTLFIKASTTGTPSEQHILGFKMSNKSLTFDSGNIPGADGVAIGIGALAGNLFVVTNLGNVYQVGLISKAKTLLASGGSRGDIIALDPNGTILFDLSGNIQRLTPPPGSTFESAKLTLSNPHTIGGLTASGLVTLAFPAPKNMILALTSGKAAATVPSQITVPAGSITASFPINTTAVAADTVCTISTTLNGIKTSANLSVLPVGVQSITTSSSTLQGGKSFVATVTLQAPAGPGPLSVSFVSSNPAVIPPPSTYSVPSGTQSFTIKVATKTVTTATPVKLAASTNGVYKIVTLTVTP